MPIHMIDSLIYSGVWGTDEMRAIFDDVPRTQSWLDVIVALAEAQAEVGLIPAEAVPEIKRICRVELLDMEALRGGYQETGHSTLGLIRELKKRCRTAAGEWVYYGATVQDVTDTWMAMALLKVWDIVCRDLRQVERDLLILAETHRDTPMPGRTHGQPGLPITFGFKVAVWVRELRRRLNRLKEVRRRLGEGQLAGGLAHCPHLATKGSNCRNGFSAGSAFGPRILSGTQPAIPRSSLCSYWP
jgi:adenylosuccinate lyase